MIARGLTRGATLAALAAALGCSSSEDQIEPHEANAGESTGQVSSALVDAKFTVTGLARKCVDVGGDAYQTIGSPVFLYGCNGTSAQKLRVVESSDGTHDVSLRASMGLCIGVRGGVAPRSGAS